MDILFIHLAESEGFEPPKHVNACLKFLFLPYIGINKSISEDI